MKNLHPTVPAILIALLCISSHFSFAQINIEELTNACSSVMRKGVEEASIPGGVLAIVSHDTVLLLKGFGHANLEANSSVDPYKTLFQLGSVGKVFTTIAALQMVEEGVLSLQTDANQYLDGWEIDNPYPTPVTLSHLLTHSAGFADRVTGYMARSNEEVEPLDEHLSRRMPTVNWKPGSEINYSNYGYGLAGLLVEKSSGLPFADYIQQQILLPLGMNQSTYSLPEKEENSGHFAKGYKPGNPFTEVPSFPRHVPPAGSIISTGADMASFLQWLLRRDTLLGNEGFQGLFSRQFSSHPLLTGYSFGFEEQNIGGRTAFSKGGSLPGFLSSIFVFPEEDLGIFLSVNANPTNVLDSLFIPLGKYFPAQKKESTEAYKNENQNLENFTGIYRNNRHNPEAAEEFFQIFQSPINISVNDKGGLDMILNGWRYSCMAMNDSVFVTDDEPEKYLVFSHFVNGKPQSLYTTVETFGLDLPVSYSRLKWYETPRFLNDNFPAVIFPIIGLYLLLPIIWLVIWGIRKIKPQALKINYLSNTSHLLGIAFSTLTVWHLIGFLFPLARRREELLLGFPADLSFFKYIHWLMVLLAIFLFGQTIRIWLKKEGWLGIRVYYSLFTLAAIAYVLFLNRWHFLSLAS